MRTFESMDEFKTYADQTAEKYNFKISKYNDDFSIDVDGNVDLSYTCLSEIPIQFNNVKMRFNCAHNFLKSLEGAPKYVGENFYCYYNRLISLEGCPEYVGENFHCSYNKITSLEGCPKYVGNNFWSYGNSELKYLKYRPEVIKGKWDPGEKFESDPEYLKYLLVKKLESL